MMTTPEEEDFFLSHININSSVLEYGSGASTLQIARRAGYVVSVEHNKEWYDKAANGEQYRNMTVLYAQQNKEMPNGYSDGSDEEFYDYVRAPWGFLTFNVVLIDGRARMACVRHLVENQEHYFGSVGTPTIFIHDCTPSADILIDREKDERVELKSNEAYRYLTKVGGVGTMMRFRLKE